MTGDVKDPRTRFPFARQPEHDAGRAALAGWSQTYKAAARVAQVTVRGPGVEVALNLEPAYLEWVYCVHGADGWRTTVSGNGPTADWQDADAYRWEP